MEAQTLLKPTRVNRTARQVLEKSVLKPSEYRVFETRDYKLFKTLSGNRAINPRSLKRLTDSMKVRPLFSPILVNDRYEIIDGQHRFIARKSLGLPIEFITIPGYGVNEIHILNSNGSNWKRTDYLHGYAEMGVRSYVMLEQFLKLFPCIKLRQCIMIAANTSRDHVFNRGGFERGEFVFGDYDQALKIGNLLSDYQQFYPGFGRISFVRAFLDIIKNKNYSHDEMLSRLARNPNQITDQTTSEKAKLQLEDIFNYHRRSKVSLRY